MIAKGRWGLAAVGILAMAAVPATNPVGQQALPDGVTAEMVEEGDALFKGTALCFTCHGQAGEGVPNLGPVLTDDTWLNLEPPPTYEAIVELINTGVAQPKEHMIPMVPRAGSGIDDAQVQAVAAYVWTLIYGG